MIYRVGSYNRNGTCFVNFRLIQDITLLPSTAMVVRRLQLTVIRLLKTKNLKSLYHFKSCQSEHVPKTIQNLKIIPKRNETEIPISLFRIYHCGFQRRRFYSKTDRCRCRCSRLSYLLHCWCGLCDRHIDHNHVLYLGQRLALALLLHLLCSGDSPALVYYGLYR